MQRCHCIKTGMPNKHVYGPRNPMGNMDLRAELGTYQQELRAASGRQ